MPVALQSTAETSLWEDLQNRGLVARELELRSANINVEERSFEAVVSTEQRVLVFDRRRYEIIEEILISRGGEFPDQMPLLPNHRMYDVLDVIGSARGFQLRDDKWHGRGYVAAPANERDNEVEAIWARVRDGHVRAVSVGYVPLEFTDIAPNSRGSVGGKTYQAGERTLRITTRWRPHELSLTPVGADSLAQIRSLLGNSAPKSRRIFR
jgi:hypothetical protein